MASAALLLVVMTACVTVQAVTKHAKLESWNYAYYARSWAHIGSVTAMELVQVHPASPQPDCRANATFGFYGAMTWVSGGCRGDFNVDIDDTDTMEQKFDQLTKDVNDGAAEAVNITLEVDAQDKLIAEIRCAVALLNEDDPMHRCCCPHGWTEHQLDGEKICYRLASTTDETLVTAEAKALCEGLHKEATLPMPKTAAQLKVLEGFGQYSHHLAINIDGPGEYSWQDGTEVDPEVVDPLNMMSGYTNPCLETHAVVWIEWYDELVCMDKDGEQDDGRQLCQLVLDTCDEE